MLQMKGVKLAKLEGSKMDPMKIVFSIEGMTGGQIWDLLEKEYKINIEKTTRWAATLTVHAHITLKDVEALILALSDLTSRTDIALVSEELDPSKIDYLK